MPFGAMYGALFFTVLAVWLVLGGGGPSGAWSPQVFLAAAAGATGVGLVLRRRFARFGGAVLAVLVALWTGRLFLLAPNPAPVLFVVGSLTCALLLLLPVTGRGTPTPPGSSALGRATDLLVVAGSVAFVVGTLWLAPSAPREAASAARPVRAESAREAAPTRVRWTDYGSGLALAASEGKPLVVTFVASWCGYCQKMDHTTWTEPQVIEKLADLVAVRVDVDETSPRNGYAGADLASRYGIRGTPALLLIDAAGRALARADGYRDGPETLAWLEAALRRSGPNGSGAPSAGVQSVSH